MIVMISYANQSRYFSYLVFNCQLFVIKYRLIYAIIKSIVILKFISQSIILAKRERDKIAVTTSAIYELPPKLNIGNVKILY